jgi:hypothetical protein
VQKAKFHTDIERFRRYLGTQYASAENYEQGTDGSGGVSRKRAMPLFTIYILGHRLAHNGDVPVIRVNRVYTDNATGANLKERDEFIESLTHDCAIIQVPALAGHRRDRLEKMLAVFDQALINPDNRHLLDVADTECPDESQVLIRRLARAVADKEVRQRMLVEDEIVNEFELRDRREDELKALAEEERRQKEEERRQKEEERRQKEAAESREAEERRQKEEQRRQKEAAVSREAEERRQKEAALAELEKLKRQLGKR